MDLERPLITKRLVLRKLSPDDVSEEYVAWLNDPDINQYLESRFARHSSDTVRGFVQAMAASDVDLLFGIFLAEDDRHIGNIRLGPIDPPHRRAAIGLLIGDTGCWGKGYASEAIDAVAGYALGTLDLHKVFAGYYAANAGSGKAFVKAGFKEESRAVRHCRYKNTWQDAVTVTRFNPKPDS